MGKTQLEQCVFDLSNMVIRWYKRQTKDGRDFGKNSLYSQFLRATTSIGANLAESKGARPDADYRSKISIALNEANEALYWLELLAYNEEINADESKEMEGLVRSAIGMLASTRKKLDERR